MIAHVLVNAHITSFMSFAHKKLLIALIIIFSTGYLFLVELVGIFGVDALEKIRSRAALEGGIVVLNRPLEVTINGQVRLILRIYTRHSYTLMLTRMHTRMHMLDSRAALEGSIVGLN